MGTGYARLDGEQRGQEGAVAGRASTVEPAVLWADETPVGRLAEVGSAALSVRELSRSCFARAGHGRASQQFLSGS